MEIQYRCEDEHVIFTAKNSVGGPDSWASENAARCAAIGVLRLYEEINPKTVFFEENRIVASHSAVASLASSQAKALNLPDRPPFVFFTDTRGNLGGPDFKIITQWSLNNKRVPTTRRGAFLKSAKGQYLIPEPIYSVIELAKSFDASKSDLPEHWKTLAQLLNLISSEFQENYIGEVSLKDLQIKTSGFLAGLQIFTGAAFSLSLSEREDGIYFDPVIYSQNNLNDIEENQHRQVSERDGMLSEELLNAFQKHPRTGFPAFDKAKKSYLLGQKTFLIVDDDLELALQVVRQKQQAGPEERRAFATNPRAAISEYLARKERMPEEFTDKDTLEVVAEDIESRAEFVFIETPEYANRAVGMELWEKPHFEFIPILPNTWLPERFSLELGGVWVLVHKDTVAELRKSIDDALSAKISHVDYQNKKIPATLEVRKKLSEIIGMEQPMDQLTDGQRKETEKKDTYILKIRKNFYELEYQNENIQKRKKYINEEVPDLVAQTLYSHQKKGFCWQIEAWCAGHPGILNADDQGLGKTLQTLSFLAWLQLNMDKGPPEKRKPILIVAPVGLLSVWESEEKQHLKGNGLGECIRVNSLSINNFRVSGLSGHDVKDGMPRLEFPKLQCDIGKGKGHNWWMLTSYETLTNFQFSFHKIDFSAVIFDEIQKVKNPQTKAFHAASSVKADFQIGLTGTPIENHVVDLWAVMDVIAPGRLGSMKDFSDYFTPVTEDSMKKLHKCLFTPEQGTPIAQRRLKQNEIQGLTRKDYRVYPTTMPDIQASAYENVCKKIGRGGTPGTSLKLLHHLRGVSLHPNQLEVAASDNMDDIDGYVKQSARLDVAQSILRSIQEQNERALVFIEDLQMQAFYAQWIRSEFGISEVRMINGTTSQAKRKKYVKSFQEHLDSDGGFDVMILSPRAAGVGLTLTAATHVIHLSRWWNPAVEEQCNDRIYRIGQKRNVTIHIPLAIHPGYQQHSFDCVLNNLMQQKTSLARAALWPSANSDYDIGNLLAGLTNTEPFNPIEIDNMTWKLFEDWVIRCAKKGENWEVSNTPWAGDKGADAVLKHRFKKDSTALVQVKHTENPQNKINEKSVTEVMHAKEYYVDHNPQLVVITNASGFTHKAEELACKNNVLLVCREQLGLWPDHVIG